MAIRLLRIFTGDDDQSHFSLDLTSVLRGKCFAMLSHSWRPRREAAMSETRPEKEIPEAWIGPRVRVGHAHGASTHTDGVLLGVGDRGIVVEGGELVRFYPWTSVGSIEKTHEESGENPGVQTGRAW